jgi:orotidine-5'-phosphate decarboxylase
VPYVFYDYTTGKPFDNVHRSFVSACKRANIRDFRFHDLRHTFASQLIMAGIDITTVKELLGHKTLTMTLRYAHLAPSHKVKAVDILDQTLTTSQTSKNFTVTRLSIMDRIHNILILLINIGGPCGNRTRDQRIKSPKKTIFQPLDLRSDFP